MGNCYSCLKRLFCCWGKQEQDYERLRGSNVEVENQDGARDTPRAINSASFPQPPSSQVYTANQLYSDYLPTSSERSQLLSDETGRSKKAERRVESKPLQQFPADGEFPAHVQRVEESISANQGRRKVKIKNGTGVNADKVNFHGPATFNINRSNETPQSERLIQIFDSMKKMLQLRYKKDLMPRFPWMPDYVLRLSALYVKLAMTPCGMYGEEVPERNIELSNIFDGTEPIGARILVEGPPAYGKSTLALKLCQDWADGTEEYIRRFELAILIRLRDFKMKNFEQELLNTARVTWPKVKDEEIEELIVRNAQKTLIVLDGYDELPDRKRKLLTPLLSGEFLSEATVVVTARPGNYDLDEDKEPASYVDIESNTFFTSVFHKRIVIKGIQEDQQSEFLYKHLSGRFAKQEVDQLNAKLSRIYDRKLFECPLFLLLVAILSLETNLASPKNRTELYKNLFNFIVQRGLFALGYREDRVDLFTYSENDIPFYIDLMRRFSKMALNSVVRRELTFSLEKILCHFTDGDERILRLGFLTHKESLDCIRQSCWYEPVHRTLMEFAAAYYLYLLWKQGDVEVFKNQVNMLSDFLPTRRAYYEVESPVFSFLTGLMADQTSFLFDALKPFQKHYTYWFDSHYEAMLSELELTEPVLTALSPFMESEWPVNTERNSSFCSTSAHEQIVEFGVRTDVIKTVKWDVNSTALFPHNMRVPNIELHMSKRPDFSYRLQGDIRCTHLCCKLLGDEITTMKEKNWLDLMDLIISFQPETMSFEFSAYCCNRFLPMLVQETGTGRLQNATFRRLKCVLQTKKEDLLKQLRELLKTVPVREVEIWLSSSPGIARKLWNDFIRQLALTEHVTVLKVKNSDRTSLVLLDESILRNGGHKNWEKVELEGYFELNITPNSQFRDVTCGEAGDAKYIKAKIENELEV